MLAAVAACAASCAAQSTQGSSQHESFLGLLSARLYPPSIMPPPSCPAPSFLGLLSARRAVGTEAGLCWHVGRSTSLGVEKQSPDQFRSMDSSQHRKSRPTCLHAVPPTCLPACSAPYFCASKCPFIARRLLSSPALVKRAHTSDTQDGADGDAMGM